MIMPAQEPKTGHAGGDPLAQRAGQVEELGQLPDRGGLAAGDDQPGRLGQVGRPAHRQRAGACQFQRAQVLGHIPLERQHPDHGLPGRRQGGACFTSRAPHSARTAGGYRC